MFAWRDNFIGYNGASGPVTDPYWTYVQLLESFENNTIFKDSSPNNFLVTPTVNPSSTSTFPPQPNFYSPFSTNYSMAFTGGAGTAGTFNYATVPNNANLNILSGGDFTIEAWICLLSVPTSSNGGPVVCRTSTGNGYILRVSNTATMTWVYPGAGAGTFGPTISLNTWYSVAVVRTGTTHYGYVNGTRYNITITNRTADSTQTTNIGGDPNSSSFSAGINALISNVRITKGTALYTATSYTPSTVPLTSGTGTQLLYACAGYGTGLQFEQIADVGPYAINLGSNGAILYNGASPFGTAYPGSYYLPSSQQTIATNALFNYSTSDFTVEGWFRLTQTGVNQYLIDQRNSGVTTSFSPTIYVNSSNNLIYFSNGADRITGASTLTTGVWYHVAASRASNTTRLFLNGVQEGSNYSDANTYVQTRVIIGGPGAGTGTTLIGYFSNVRLSRGFAYYTSNFTPSTTPLGINASYTVLLISGSQLVTDSSNSTQPLNMLGTIGASRPTAANFKFGTQSLRNQATGFQVVQTGLNSENLQFGTGDFTIECWVYRDATGANHTIASKGSGATGWTWAITNTNQVIWTSNGTTIKTSSTAIPATTWTYLSITRTGTTSYMFINGTQEGSSFTDSTNYNNAGNFRVGANLSNGTVFVGYIDEFRVTVGICRYTATYTAPTEAFPTS